LVVADRGVGHGPAHGLGRAGEGVGTQIDQTVGHGRFLGLQDGAVLAVWSPRANRRPAIVMASSDIARNGGHG
jgi:hypothetical protein